MFNKKPFTVRPEDHVLPETFQFGSKNNRKVGDILETASFLGSLFTAAFSAFIFLTKTDDYIANRNAANRENGGSWF